MINNKKIKPFVRPRGRKFILLRRRTATMKIVSQKKKLNVVDDETDKE